MSRLQGKIAIVTGAGAGQGAEEARILAQLGAKVVATDLNHAAVQDVVAGINREQTGDAIALEHDVSSCDSWSSVAEKTQAAFGAVNVLVNNAGILNRTAYDELTLEAWQETMNTNAWGVFTGIKTVAPIMIKAGGGSIINIASTAAVTAAGGFSAYTASKGAIDALTRGAAIEFASNNIRVNCINPGIIKTSMIKGGIATAEALSAAASAIPLGRLGQPSDIAYLVAYLASDEAWFTTGASIVVDGGVSIEGGHWRVKTAVAATG